jgi:zinc protease
MTYTRARCPWLLVRLSLLVLLLAGFLPSPAAGQAPAPAPAPPAQTPPAAALDLQAPLPFDPAVRRGTLENGLAFYVRQNDRPANRLLLRLAVQAGSLDEADDQQGLAHFVEHMAFNGSRHFAPGELIAYFEKIGARLGPHVNAYTSFEETVYMLDVPTDQPEPVQKALTALLDFAGGINFDPEQVEKERGVVIEEWRGGLGAASRIRDQQIPVLYHDSRYAERLPIGKPEVLRTAPVERLRAFYDTFYRPDRMALVAVGDIDPAAIEQTIRSMFGALKARGPEPPARNDRVPFHDDTLVSMVTDPEAARSSVSIVRKRPRPEQGTVGDYRRDLVQRLGYRVLNERFDELARRPDARILGAGVGDGRLSPAVESLSLSAGVEDGRIEDGVATLVVEANRARQHGFAESEVDRARRTIAAFYDRAYAERDKTESGSFAREYVSHFLTGEPSPGIEYEYRLAQQVLPAIAATEVSALAQSLLHDGSRVVLAVSPQRDGVRVPAADDLVATLAKAEQVAVTPWTDTAITRDLMEQLPEAAAVRSRREIPELGVTVVRFANGLEAWLKPTDFKNDEIVFTMYARGGASLAPPAAFVEASLATAYASLSGAGGLRAIDLQRLLAGRLLSASPFISLSTHGVSGSSVPAQLETALQLLHLRVTTPGDDPDAFALLRRQLEAAVVNRTQDPMTLFGERVSEINASGHYTAEPLTMERVGTLDRRTMVDFYRQRFANAADFTFFMVGAFGVDEAVPLLARYLGTLPADGEPGSQHADLAIRFPEGIVRDTVVAGREPRSQTALSFFAEPSIEPAEQQAVSAATTVLSIALRDILREELGQTYGVSVGLVQRLPQRGSGHVALRFGSDPGNAESMVGRVLQEVQRLQQEGPGSDLTMRAKETARRNLEVAVRQNGYWLGQLQSAHLFGREPLEILDRPRHIEAVTERDVQQVFTRYFPLDRYTVVTLLPAAPAPGGTADRGEP